MNPIPVRNPDVVWREEPEERDDILTALEQGGDVSERGWVVLVEGGRMHELNLMAGEIWCLADGSRDVQAMAQELAARYDAPPEEIVTDVEAFIGECLTKGWMQVRDV